MSGEIELVEVRDADLGDLAGPFCRWTSHVPLCGDVSAEAFAGAVLDSRAPTDPGRCPETIGTHIIVARVGGRTVGFVDMTVARMDLLHDGSRTTEALISMIVWAPGMRAAGRALLDECVRIARLHRACAIRAFHKYHVWRPYHLGLGGVSDRMTHVLAMLLSSGLVPCEGEIADVILERSCAGADTRSDRVAFDLSTRWSRSRLHEFELTIECVESGRHLGVCECESIIEGCPLSDAGTTAVIGWIHVEPDARRRGIGRAMIDRAYEELRARRIDRLLTVTNLGSPESLCFYTNASFRVVDVAYHELRRGLVPSDV